MEETDKALATTKELVEAVRQCSDAAAGVVKIMRTVTDMAARVASPLDARLETVLEAVARVDRGLLSLGYAAHQCNPNHEHFVTSFEVTNALVEHGYGRGNRTLSEMCDGPSPFAMRMSATGFGEGTRYAYRPTSLGFALIDAIVRLDARRNR